ncbi:hypothetical protein [Paenibacillus rigui]|uniref:Uncharacterized protein n=1 Tax=Paenibacillus rigui TaxID=554312 RepID=A0A229UKQ5_9BACL|nr:hypothetical protein [Paenibacillus rigui]OXM83990.1 hypothetical protein CF651_23040 [Paenibacillus rigui]
MSDDKDNIISIDVLRINRRVPKKCTCKVRKFTVDTENREITCGCGVIVDPFEAMLHLATNYEYINRQHQSLNEQRKEWLKQKPYSVIFKRLEKSYSRGTMLPYCPKCNQLFDYKDINSHGNAEFYRRLEQKLRQQEMNI